MKGRCVINIDKFPLYPEAIVQTVRRHNMVDQALVKTDQNEKYYKMVMQRQSRSWQCCWSLPNSQVSLTLQLYAHSSMETKKKEMEKMDAFL